MIKIMATGNLGRDPEQSGNGPCKFSIASTRKYSKASGEKVEETTWLRVSAWGKLGEVCLAHLKKGRQVAVVGNMQTSEYEKDGQKRTGTECVAESVEFLGGGAGKREAGEDSDEPAPSVPKPGEKLDDFGI